MSYSTPGDNVPFDHSYLLKKHVHNIELSQMRVVSKGQGDREREWVIVLVLPKLSPTQYLFRHNNITAGEKGKTKPSQISIAFLAFRFFVPSFPCSQI